jgi:hypothetical protein
MAKEKECGCKSAALFIPGGLLVGMGVGFLTNLVAGMFIGLGAGFIIFALIKLMCKCKK